MGPDHLILFIILRYIQHYPKNSDWQNIFGQVSQSFPNFFNNSTLLLQIDNEIR